jgi:hypothetical protein
LNKDCASIRKLLPKYVRGHVFKYQQIRVRKHLDGCPLCRSELFALERIDDTKRILEDVHAPDGPVLGMMEAVRRIFRSLRVLLYRPLWLLVITGCAVFVYFNLLVPHRDVEIENIEKSLPPPSAPVSAQVPTSAPAPAAAAPAPTPAKTAVAAASAPSVKPEKHPPTVGASDPLVVIITLNSETTAEEVNEVLHGYSQFKRKAFSESVREISGTLAYDEFLELARGIEPAGKVSYDRKKLSSFPEAQPIPIVMKLKSAPRPVQRIPSAPAPSEASAGTPSAPAPEPTQAAP